VEIWLAIIVVAVVVLAALFLLARSAARPGADPTQLTFDPTMMEEVRALTVSGQKVQAIKMLREQTPGLALVTAKLIVDRMEASANRPRAAGVAGDDSMPSASVVPFEVELEARNLKSQGQPITAIKLVRQRTGLDLKAAKDYVDGL
jgi:ribosomal protein L7/L12